MEMIKIAMIGLSGVLLALMLKQQKPEYGLYIGIGCGICIMFCSVQRISVVMESVKLIYSHIPLEGSYMKALLKMMGITFVAEFASGLCQDAGYGSVGSQIELFGKLSILALSMPILLALIRTLEGFLT